jgi:cysteine desulfurase
MTVPDSIYLDHNATTPTRPEVVEAMARCYGEGYANPASQHRPGQRAHKVLTDARERLAEILGADLTCSQPDRLIFTSGGTEANNLAILGMALASRATNEIVVSAIEHASVIGPAEHLLDAGWTLHTLGTTPDGVVRTEQLHGLLSDRTRVVSVILGNHETGVLQPVAELAAVCAAAGVPMHTDAVQVAGKLPVDFRRLGVAAMTVAAHKFQGPLGIGALILRHDVSVIPQLFGGHQQSGLRPGTESVALAVGMATALELWQQEQDSHLCRLRWLRDRLEAGIRAGFPDAIVHGASAARLPQTTNVAFPGLDAQVLLMTLDVAGVACSVGSACSSGSTELSPTLRAMGLPADVVRSSLRLSVGATTTEAEIDEAVRRILQVCEVLQA